jgi:predicted RNA-binding protein with RPS1 domain
VASKYPVGAQVEGIVRNLTSYGAFIEIEEGVDGLLHVSDMSWVRKVTNPSEGVNKGDKIRCVVLEVDQERKRIALGLKQMASDPWAGKNIGIQMLSTTGFELAGGYWDLDHVRLTETVAPVLGDLRLAENRFTFTLLSEPGWRFDIEASTNFTTIASAWSSIGTFTNTTGAGSFTDTASNLEQRYYRARRL